MIDYLNHNEINALLNEITLSRDLAIVLLFLNTGLFLNEVTDLQINDIDWEKKTIKIKGHRERTIQLNNEVFNALAQWSQDRIDSECTSFFTTTKGKIQSLSARSIDHLIRKYASGARFTKKVNAHILRNTFAIQLCQAEPKKEVIKSTLGLIDSDILKRYLDTAKSLQESPSALPLKQDLPLANLDHRSFFSKLIQSVFPITPKISKPLQAFNGFIEPDPKEVIFGRDRELKQIKLELQRGQSMLVTGKTGLGKTYLIKHLASVLPHACYLSSPNPIKQLLTDILSYTGQQPESKKASTRILLNQIIQIPHANRPILIIDDLSKLKQPDIDILLQLLTHFIILSATDELVDRLKVIWWKFEIIELEPLSEPSTKELIRYLTQNLAISDYDMLETKLLSQANGNPMAITDMIRHASHHPVVNRQTIRDLYHEAGLTYREWSNMLIVLWGLLIMSRFIALGTHSFEGYILAGLGTSVFLVLRYFMQRMK